MLLVIHLSGLTSLDVDYLEPVSNLQTASILKNRQKFEKVRNPLFHPVDRRKQR